MVFRKSKNLGVDLELKNLVFENFSFFGFPFGLWSLGLGISSLGFGFWVF